jgi:DNA polymerase-3 subunit beta
MKTILPRQDFQDALTAIATLTGGRTTRPVLACVRLSAEGERLELSATDGEAGLRLGVPALSVEEPGEVVVPAERVLAIVRELTDVEVALEVDERYCIIRGEGSEFHIFVMSVADFPPVADFEDEPDLVIDGGELRRMISLTLYAAARETSRYAINGVLWEKQGRRLFLVATDGRRLARAGGAVGESSSGDFEAILPAKAMSVFEKVFLPVRDEAGWSVDIKIMPNQVLLRSGDRVLSTVLVEGSFPKYDDVVPKEHNKEARIDREALFGAVRRAALLTTEESRAVKLAFDSASLVITSQTPERGDARVEIPISYEGEPLVIGFNPAFLNDALRVVPFEEVFLDLHESFRPGLLRGEDKNEFLYVVMPVSLSA